tara:strand:- start:870 stop:1043 length:174 start_codon:yes stop_codon:yes gene_type:complete
MTAGSQFGYQPHPLPPLDIKKFHEHRRQLVGMYQDRLFRPQIKGLEVKNKQLKSTNK